MATVGDAVLDVRTLLQDKRVPYRYTDEELVRDVVGFVAVARRVRPDFLVGVGTKFVPDPSDPATLLIELPEPFNHEFYSVVVDYTFGRTLMRDDQYADEGVAASLVAKASAALLTTGM